MPESEDKKFGSDINPTTGNFINKEKSSDTFTEGELHGERTTKGHRERHQDTIGRVDFEREYFYSSDKDLEEGNYSAYEKRYDYADDGESKQESGKDLHKDNEWQIEHQLNKDGSARERVGEIVSGDDKGHRWKEKYGQREAKIVWQGQERKVILYTDEGEILAQGDNPNKEEKGHVWKKWTAVDKKSGESITHWGEKELPRGEWGKPPEVII
ncbi:MAG: hypothetical protein V1838_01920 [Patescibacteria group bacterium]